MGGKPLATAALAAAAVANRSPSDYSVLAFGKNVVVAKGQLTPKPSELVVNDVLWFRGFGTTDLGRSARVAGAQLERSRAGRKVTVLLSDCRSTVDGDPVAAAGALTELVVVAPNPTATRLGHSLTRSARGASPSAAPLKLRRPSRRRSTAPADTSSRWGWWEVSR